LETIDESKLDEFYFITKGIVNDYKTTLKLLSKINRLLEFQHMFCQKILINDIFEKICEIICQTLECDRSTLYLVDNIRRELWSKAAKDSKDIIKLPFGKGLAGFVAETKTNLILDDAYSDSRFIKDYDNKTGYRTKSVLCVPIFDNETKEVIGVIQSLNKTTKPNIFDNNDVVASELLAKMISYQVKQSMDYSDHTVHENKLKKLMTSTHCLFVSESLLDLMKNCQNLVKNIFSCDKVELFLNLKEFKLINNTNIANNTNIVNASYYKYVNNSNDFIEVSDLTNSGIVGYTINKKLLHFVQSTFNNSLYNPRVDIDTSLPVITFPIFSTTNEHKIISVVQLEYNVARLGISDFRITQVNQIDANIIELLTEIFSMNLAKFVI
jgi:putative methionine-R-sulfoxide reductase with GAF domain